MYFMTYQALKHLNLHLLDLEQNFNLIKKLLKHQGQVLILIKQYLKIKVKEILDIVLQRVVK